MSDARVRRPWILLAALAALFEGSAGCRRSAHDLVVTNVHYLSGERITPELYHVAVRGDSISYVGTTKPAARLEIDGHGGVLAPGFLDTNVPGFIYGARASGSKLLEGVTTYLSAHGGLPGDNLAAHGRTTVLNYATTVGLVGLHARLRDPAFDVLGALDAAVAAGAYGISLSPEYEPNDATPERVRAICNHFAARPVPISFHSRYSSIEQELEGVEEAFDCARRGAVVHLLHLSSTGGTHHPREAAAIVQRARYMGFTMFFDFYPYTSWASSVQRARFKGDWRARYGIDWDRVWLPGRARPLDAAAFDELRATGKHWVVAVDSIPKETIDYFALQSDATIGTDTATGSAVHPRGAGSFAKFLHEYVGGGKISLDRALYRFSTMACERFAPYVPDLARRGRIAPGYAADLVLWNPANIRDHATLAQPLQPSSGVEAVVLNGAVVVEHGRPVHGRAETGHWMRGRSSQP